jgi:glycosyltransferase involved in cell wall biosynthesis
MTSQRCNKKIIFISHNDNYFVEGASKFIFDMYKNMHCEKYLLSNENNIIGVINKNLHNDVHMANKNMSNKLSNIVIYLNTVSLLPLINKLHKYYTCVLIIHENNVNAYINEIDLWNGDEKAFSRDLLLCDKIIFVCEKTRDKYVKYIKNVKNDVIYNGIKINENLNKNYNVDKCLRICMIGTICDRKNQVGLIKYFSNNNSRYNIDLYGQCSTSFIDKLTEHTNYKYKRIFINMQVNDILSNYDIIISNSYDECLPYNILEAMSNEVVAISSNCGGIAEIITNGVDGYIYDIEDYEKVISILDILDNDRKQLKIIGQNGRNKIINKFNLSKSVELHTDMCNKLIE